MEKPPIYAGETAFQAVYPEGHELEGQEESREIQCVTCFRQVTQTRVNRPFLENMHKDRRRLFLVLCTVEPGKEPWHPPFTTWFPKECTTCQKRELRP